MLRVPARCSLLRRTHPQAVAKRLQEYRARLDERARCAIVGLDGRCGLENDWSGRFRTNVGCVAPFLRHSPKLRQLGPKKKLLRQEYAEAASPIVTMLI
jgi:hypothetical protein